MFNADLFRLGRAMGQMTYLARAHSKDCVKQEEIRYHEESRDDWNYVHKEDDSTQEKEGRERYGMVCAQSREQVF